MAFQKRQRPRLAVLSVFMAIVLVFYAARVFSLQISNAETYINQALGISYRTVTVKAQRGEILDSDGRKIAVNREGYNIVFNKAYVKDNINDVRCNVCSHGNFSITCSTLCSIYTNLYRIKHQPG